ncbi:MAG: malectin domain-containing carbohydrate-binding protein, partial [Bryobacteraceae bacterium]
VFHILINNQIVQSNFDVYAAAGGKNIAVDRQFTVNVTNGQIAIRPQIVSYGNILNALEITQ